MNAISMKLPPIPYEGLIMQTLALALGYFLPVKPLIHAVLFLFCMDWILGVWKSRKAHRRLTSYRFRKSISKITTYVIAIMSTFVLEKTFLPEWGHITQIIAGYIAFTELTSIYENMSEITGRKLMKDLLGVLKRNFNNILKPKP
jgi:phage-related holin